MPENHPDAGADRLTRLQDDIHARTGIDAAMIRRLVHGFYDRVRADPVLGPIFDARIPAGRWPAHLDKMCAFWSAVALMSGAYHGRPVQAHAPLGIEGAHFDRWLALFRDSARALTPPAAAALFIERAERIAQSMGSALEMQRARGTGAAPRFTTTTTTHETL
jgi:hemoglobin